MDPHDGAWRQANDRVALRRQEAAAEDTAIWRGQFQPQRLVHVSYKEDRYLWVLPVTSEAAYLVVCLEPTRLLFDLVCTRHVTVRLFCFVHSNSVG
jgi:hypothetical protein